MLVVLLGIPFFAWLSFLQSLTMVPSITMVPFARYFVHYPITILYSSSWDGYHPKTNYEGFI